MTGGKRSDRLCKIKQMWTLNEDFPWRYVNVKKKTRIRYVRWIICWCSLCLNRQIKTRLFWITEDRKFMIFSSVNVKFGSILQTEVRFPFLRTSVTTKIKYLMVYLRLFDWCCEFIKKIRVKGMIAKKRNDSLWCASPAPRLFIINPWREQAVREHSGGFISAPWVWI